MRIVMTGASGCLARALLPELCGLANVSEVVGIDVRLPDFAHPVFRHLVLDMRSAAVADVVRGKDAVIHLGFAVKRAGRALAEMRDINVGGSCNVVDAAVRERVHKFINLSSVSVYGSGENLLETTPVNPSANFFYARHKAEVEDYVARQLPAAVQLRSHLIIGAHAQAFLREMFEMPIWFRFPGAPPRQQVVHEQDVVAAILCALHNDVRGVFNLAAPQVVALGGDYIAEGANEGRHMRPLPFALVKRMAKLGKHLLNHDMLTWIEMLDTSATVNCDKAARELGWYPCYSAWDARRDAMAANG